MMADRPRILFIVTSADRIGPRARATGFEFSEVAHPYDELSRRGWTVDFASPRGGRPPEEGYDPHDAVSRSFREGPGYARLGHSAVLAAVESRAYDAIFFPGGLGPMVDLAHDAVAAAVIAAVYETGRIVAAVCHGPAVLLQVVLASGRRLVNGKRVAAFTTAEEQGHSSDDVPYLLDDALKRAGAVHTHAPPFMPHVVVDGRLVTGQNPASARGVATAIVRLVEGAEHADAAAERRIDVDARAIDGDRYSIS